MRISDWSSDVCSSDLKQMPCSPHAGHDRVQNKQHAVAVANFAYALQISLDRRQRPGGRADHGFGHKGRYVFSTQFLDFVVELLCQTLGIALFGFARKLIAVGIDRKSTRLNSSH